MARRDFYTFRNATGSVRVNERDRLTSLKRSPKQLAHSVNTPVRLMEMAFMGFPNGSAQSILPGKNPTCARACSRRLEQVRIKLVLKLEIAVDALVSRAALVPDNVQHSVRDSDAVDHLKVTPSLFGSKFATY
jgi:hypothetical protein